MVSFFQYIKSNENLYMIKKFFGLFFQRCDVLSINSIDMNVLSVFSEYEVLSIL